MYFFLNTGNGYYHFITVYTFSDYNLLPRGTFSFIFYYLLSRDTHCTHYQGTQPATASDITALEKIISGWEEDEGGGGGGGDLY